MILKLKPEAPRVEAVEALKGEAPAEAAEGMKAGAKASSLEASMTGSVMTSKSIDVVMHLGTSGVKD
jgi:hypothetical protein